MRRSRDQARRGSLRDQVRCGLFALWTKLLLATKSRGGGSRAQRARRRGRPESGGDHREPPPSAASTKRAPRLTPSPRPPAMRRRRWAATPPRGPELTRCSPSNRLPPGGPTHRNCPVAIFAKNNAVDCPTCGSALPYDAIASVPPRLGLAQTLHSERKPNVDRRRLPIHSPRTPSTHHNLFTARDRFGRRCGDIAARAVHRCIVRQRRDHLGDDLVDPEFAVADQEQCGFAHARIEQHQRGLLDRLRQRR